MRTHCFPDLGARCFAIHDVTPDGHHLVEAVQFASASDEDGQHSDASEDRLTPRVAALNGCALLFVGAIGGPAAAKVVNARVHPMKIPTPEPIEQVLDRVRDMLATNPPPWLRRIMREEGLIDDAPAHDSWDDDETTEAPA